MTGRLLYPRLSEGAARSLYLELQEADVGDAVGLSRLSHESAHPAPTGGTPVGETKLAGIRDGVRAVATAAGFPSTPRHGDWGQFDRPCGTFLFREMDIVPADAAVEGVWSFLTLVLLPEIGIWRFDSRAEERLLGKQRNVLRRDWWRAWALGPDLDAAPEGTVPLGEDEFVQIMERPSLGGDPRVARAIRDACFRCLERGKVTSRMFLMRRAALLTRATKSMIALEALSDAELCSLLDQVMEDARLDLETPSRTGPSS